LTHQQTFQAQLLSGRKRKATTNTSSHRLVHCSSVDNSQYRPLSNEALAAPLYGYNPLLLAAQSIPSDVSTEVPVNSITVSNSGDPLQRLTSDNASQCNRSPTEDLSCQNQLPTYHYEKPTLSSPKPIQGTFARHFGQLEERAYGFGPSYFADMSKELYKFDYLEPAISSFDYTNTSSSLFQSDSTQHAYMGDTNSQFGRMAPLVSLDSLDQPRKQRLRFHGDMYTPLWVRFQGQQKEGFCDLCQPGKWLQLKNSAFW
jgi:hypothetical protein